jgi:hypothetical protein
MRVFGGLHVKMKRVIHFAGAGAVAFIGVVGLSGVAGATAAQKLPATVFNPAITGPPPPGVTIPANCPAFLSSDSWSLNFVSGNGVGYGTMNKNGDWGGGNAEGVGVLSTSDCTPVYQGHLHVWFGQGENSLTGANQTETGFTLSFNGTGSPGSLTINAHMHSTTNNAGTPTANVFGATVSCS